MFVVCAYRSCSHACHGSSSDEHDGGKHHMDRDFFPVMCRKRGLAWRLPWSAERFVHQKDTATCVVRLCVEEDLSSRLRADQSF